MEIDKHTIRTCQLYFCAIVFLSFGIFVQCQIWYQYPMNNPWPSERRGHSLHLYQERLYIFGGRREFSVNRSYELFEYFYINKTAVLAANATNCLNSCYNRGVCNEFRVCECEDGYTADDCSSDEREDWFSDVWYYDFWTGRWTNIPQGNNPMWPQPRYHHGSTLINDSIFVFAGASQSCIDFCADIWLFNITTASWTLIDAGIFAIKNGPGARWQHTTEYYNNKVYVWGGHKQGKFLGDLWTFDMTSYNWTLIHGNCGANSTCPLPRIGQETTIYDNKMYFFGGFTMLPSGLSDYLNDFWRFHFSNNTWELLDTDMWVERPEPRAHTSLMVIDNLILLFGGYSNNFYHDGLYRFNMSSWQWTKQQIHFSIWKVPQRRSEHGVVFHPRMHVMVLYGGWGSNSDGIKTTYREEYFPQLWHFNFSSCPGQCNGRGVCEYGYCFCEKPYYGPDCEFAACPDTQCVYDPYSRLPNCTHCGGRGTCHKGVCRCTEYFAGDSCENLVCPNQCSGHGTCVVTSDVPPTTRCQCKTAWTLDDCSLVQCKNNCSYHGICDEGDCKCDQFYYGDDCSFFSASVYVASTAVSLALKVVPFCLALLTALLAT